MCTRYAFTGPAKAVHSHHEWGQRMCGRYAITLPPEAIREWFRTLRRNPELAVYYNAAPTTALPVVRQGKEGSTASLNGRSPRA
jgi:hypothetical protein